MRWSWLRGWETLRFTLPDRERGASITESCDGMGPVAGKVPNEPAGDGRRLGVGGVRGAGGGGGRAGRGRAGGGGPAPGAARFSGGPAPPGGAALARLRFWRKARA